MSYPFPDDSAPLKVEVQETETVGSVTVQTLTYFSHFIGTFPLRTAAYLAIPEGESLKPGLLHLHGGAQQAEKQVALEWAGKGYVTLCIDWSVCANVKNAVHATVWPEGMPNMQGRSLPLEQCSVPHIVRSARRGLDLLCETPGVDAERLGMVGISWGGFMTWLVNGTDRRLRCAVPVYGCGFPCPDESERAWFEAFHPDQYAKTQHGAVLHVNGTHDFFGRLQQAESILGRLSVDRKRVYVPNEDHGLSNGARETVWAWLAHYLQGGTPLPEEPTLEREGLQVKARAPGAESVTLHTLNHEWEEDVWIDHEMSPDTARDLPRGSGSAFLTAAYPGGLHLSSPVKILPGEPEIQAPPPQLFLRWETGNLVAHRHPDRKILQTPEGLKAEPVQPEMSFHLRIPEQDQRGHHAFILEWTAPDAASLELNVVGQTGAKRVQTTWIHPRIHTVNRGRQRFTFAFENMVCTDPADGPALTEDTRIRSLRISLKAVPPKNSEFIFHGFTWA